MSKITDFIENGWVSAVDSGVETEMSWSHQEIFPTLANTRPQDTLGEDGVKKAKDEWNQYEMISSPPDEICISVDHRDPIRSFGDGKCQYGPIETDGPLVWYYLFKWNGEDYEAIVSPWYVKEYSRLQNEVESQGRDITGGSVKKQFVAGAEKYAYDMITKNEPQLIAWRDKKRVDAVAKYNVAPAPEPEPSAFEVQDARARHYGRRDDDARDAKKLTALVKEQRAELRKQRDQKRDAPSDMAGGRSVLRKKTRRKTRKTRRKKTRRKKRRSFKKRKKYKRRSSR